ncbi:MAG: hypothetical protein V2A54_02800 [Bacteroidota bacterium]
MKKILISLGFVLCFSALSLAQNTTYNTNEKVEKECVIVRVKYGLKKLGFTHNIYIETGEAKFHSLKGKVENTEAGIVKVYDDDGKVLMLKNEADLFGYVLGQGYNLIDSFTIKIINDEYTQYVFCK